jgi:ParB/RepB/Spo0J family partition protein
MSTITTTTMPVADIKIREGFNVRQNGSGIDELAASIELLGILVPLIVDVDGHLVAGHRRLAAAQKLGLERVPVHIGEAEGLQGAERGVAGAAAAENIMRQQLAPAEEAEAIQRMLDVGYTSDGAAQALGLSKQLVHRRMVLLALPPDLRTLWGPGGTAALNTATAVAALLTKAPGLAPHLKRMHDAALDDNVRGGRHIDQLARDPDRYLEQLERAAIGSSWDPKLKGMPKLPKDFALIGPQTRLAQQASNLVTGKLLAAYKDLDRQLQAAWVHNVDLMVNAADVDAARAAGVTVKLPESDTEYILSASWLRARIESDIFPRYEKKALAAIKRSASSRGKTSTAAAGSKATGEQTAAEKREKDLRRAELDAAKRWKQLAPGANLDLGRSLLNALGTVEVTVDVARFFAETSLGGRPPAKTERRYRYGYDDPRQRPAARMAAAGLRYVMPGWQTEQTREVRGKPKTETVYLSIEDAEQKLWEWFDIATEPGELLGRALIIHAAARWANEHCLPKSERVMGFGPRYTTAPERAREALEKIAGSHLPATVTQLLNEISTFDPAKARA